MKVPKARSGELVHNGTERSVRASVCVSVRHVSAVYVYDVCEWCVCGVCICCGVCMTYSMYMLCGACGVCVCVCVVAAEMRTEAGSVAPAAHTRQRQIVL